MVRRALLLATLLCALPARAPADEARGSADAGVRGEQPLSQEDADVAKQLAALEEIELVQNLDLFDDRSAGASKTPDAGTPDAGTLDAGITDAGSVPPSQP